jgi:uncharacterized iron-regulated membrane protein
MAGAHEHLEHAEHTEHAAHSNRKIALMIAVIALCLAFSETLGKSAQTAALSHNVEASNLWAFFQAKTIRTTVLRTMAEMKKLEVEAVPDEAKRAELQKQIDAWNKTAARYDDEPSTNEGRKQLSSRAVKETKARDVAMDRYHLYEFASAAFQIGIVLCSAAVITSMVALAWLAGGLTVAGLGLMGLGLFMPDVMHLVH